MLRLTVQNIKSNSKNGNRVQLCSLSLEHITKSFLSRIPCRELQGISEDLNGRTHLILEKSKVIPHCGEGHMLGRVRPMDVNLLTLINKVSLFMHKISEK